MSRRDNGSYSGGSRRNAGDSRGRTRGRSPPSSSMSSSHRSGGGGGGGGGGGHQSRRGGAPPNGDMEFSSYYRDRFGSHSPEEYRNLRLSHIDPKVGNSQLRESLEKEFRKYGDMTVKVVQQNSDEDRLAYINFDRPDLARRARKQSLFKLQSVLGRFLKIDPAGVIRDQDGRYVDREEGAGGGVGGGAGGSGGGGGGRGRDFGGGGGRGRNYSPHHRAHSPFHQRSHRYYPQNRHYHGDGSDVNWLKPRSPSPHSHRFPSISSRPRIRSPPFINKTYRVPANAAADNKTVPGQTLPFNAADEETGRAGAGGAGGGTGGNRGVRGGAGNRGVRSPAPSAANNAALNEFKLRESLEDDGTRTLVVDNLPTNCDKTHLKRIFTRYGRIERIDLKAPQPGDADTYAYVIYENMDMAQEAKYFENNKVLAGGKRCTITYGKPKKTRRLFVGGLGTWTSIESLAKEFDRYGAIEKIDYIRGGDHAYATFGSVEAATEACNAMKGFPLGGRDRCIRIDFSNVPPEDNNSADNNSSDGNSSDRARRPDSPSTGGGGPAKKKQRRRSRSTSVSSRDSTTNNNNNKIPPNSKRSISRGPNEAHRGGPPNRTKGPRTPPNSPPPSPTPNQNNKSSSPTSHPTNSTNSSASSNNHKNNNGAIPGVMSAGNLTELEQIDTPCWTGALILKKASYAIRFYKYKGDDDLIDSRLRDQKTQESINLSITQRRPLASSNPAEYKKYIGHAGAAFLLATPNPNATAADLQSLADTPTRPFKDLVRYLTEKNAGGVVTVRSEGTQGSALLYLFPKSQLTQQVLKELAPKSAVMDNSPGETLMGLLVRTKPTNPQNPRDNNSSAPAPSPAPSITSR